jgi:hypothetical protein
MPRPFRVLAVGVVLVLATAGATTSASAAAAGTGAASARGAASATPALPDSMAAIGDSITQAVDVCCFYGNWPGYSWSTGYVPLDGIASHYERIRARNPAIRGHRWNNAVSGAQMADAPGQARRTVSETLDILRTGLPGAHVFVASIPNLHQLWSVLRTDPLAQAVWQAAGICPSMLNFFSSPADRQAVIDRERAFNDVLRDVCATWSNCRFDNYLTYDYAFTRDMVSRLDFFHPSLRGQATLAALTWEASWWGS